MAQKIFFTEVEDQSPIGTASTTYLDPFGTPTTTLLSGFGQADISVINPYFLNITTDYVYNQLDSIALHLTKTVVGSDSAFTSDKLQSFDFNKRLFETSLLVDQIQSISFTKTLKDSQGLLDKSSLDFTKALSTSINSPIDNDILNFTKSLKDVLDQQIDEIESFVFNKRLFDNQTTIDQIQSFSVIKLLQDFANPVDLVNIPDGSTFQLVKTLRNTVDGIIDEQSFVVTKLLSDESTIEETTYLHTHKPAIDDVFNNDFSSLAFIKAISEFASSNETLALFVEKSLSDFATGEDQQAIRFSKSISEDASESLDRISSLTFNKNLLHSQIVEDAIQSFAFNKALQDFANPVDLVNIPDGSTFQLVKSLRNTVENIVDVISLSWIFNRSLSDVTEFITDQQLLNFAKVLDDNQSISDVIQSITLGRVLKSQQSILDDLTIEVSSLKTDSLSISDESKIHLTILQSDFNLIDDSIETLSFGKNLSNALFSNDQIQSFVVNKILQDFANPVDLISIPDGSTFELIKTLRNTVSLSDQASLVWYFNRSFDDAFSISDLITFIGLGKYREEYQFVNDNVEQLIVNKTLFENIISNELVALSTSKSITNQISSLDQSTLLIDKALSHVSTTSDNLESFIFNKLLNELPLAIDNSIFFIAKTFSDFANPVDLIGIPDGSTIQFSKTLRNTALTEERKYLHAHKVFFESFDNSTQFNQLTSDIDFDNAVPSVLDLNTDYTGYVDFNDGSNYLPDGSRIFDVLVSNFNKKLFTSTSAFDNVGLLITKSVSDTVTVLDSIFSGNDIVDFIDDSANISEFIALDYSKLLSDTISTPDDSASLSSLLNKEESVSNADVLQSISFAKLLQDFANPVDLVNIPDGSTFQLVKSLRNTVLTQDQTNLVWYFNRALLDEQLALDTYKLSAGKTLKDAQQANDDYAIIISKSLFDSVTVLDEVLQGRDISDTASDSTSVFEYLTYTAAKGIFDSSTAIEDLSYSFNKELFDEYEPLDNVSLNPAKSFDDDNSTDDFRSSHVIKAFAEYFTPEYINNFSGDNDYENESLGDWDLNIGDIYADFNTGAFKITNIIYDKLESISFNKGISDFANPVDLVGIPDGSIFQFNKTLRNTVLLDDQFNRIVFYNRDFSDLFSVEDFKQLEHNKRLTEDVNLNDVFNKQAQYIRSFEDFISVNDILSLASGNAENPFDTLIINDNNILSVAKTINDQSLINDFANKSLDKKLNDFISQIEFSTKVLGKYIADVIFVSDDVNAFKGSSTSALDLITLNDINTFRLNKAVPDNLQSIDNISSKSIMKTLKDFITVIDNSVVSGAGNDYTSSQGDLSNIEDSGFLYMTDYADITYFAEDYVGESRTFT